ncbi:amino acid/amide ABC transporter substrate-binding protein, HAAT family [Poseidonocella pacifica]|uniref:Amino acid/amide ABC transporter substrate-binding protein, HAAT family n=1 Tax=Poseidonocella pacifica TaxID=871651 RepID=A0A1I0V2F4_9RHOB|nr:amino acid ABC transporter substrate-binding protein [Poseidonocella pacifica]SFA70498.1 amino acid/amide ABC transporter substrate-binding protein, HAAT family [Poseidonocella pacifica]
MKTNLALGLASIVASLGAPAFSQDGPIKIGASLPLTGSFSIAGQKHQQGYELCVDLINERGGILGREVELIVSDNRSDPATAINQYERFLNVDGVEAVYGTFSSRLSFPVANILARNGMVHALPAGGALRIYEQGHDNIFYFQPNAAEYVGASLAGVVRDLVPAEEAPKTVAIISADDFFANGVWSGLMGEIVTDPADGSEVADLSPGYLAELGLEVVYSERWPEEGFNDWLNLANQVRQTEPDLIIGLTASAEEAVQLTRAFDTVRATPQMVYFSQGTQAEYLEGTGDSAQGVLVHTSWHSDAPFQSLLAGSEFSNQDFVGAYEAAYGSPPDEDSAIPFAVCQGIEQAMVGAGTTDNAAMGDWLDARTKEDAVRTILGRFSWDDRGLPVEKPFLMTQWNDGELQFIYPTDEFEGVSAMSYPKGSF